MIRWSIFAFSSLLLFGADTPAERELLLHPKALGARVAPTSREVRERFTDPAAEYRSMPLWVWNDEMDPARIREMLAQYKKQGIGGVFVHPRPGLMTEYLGTEWFRLWRLAVEEGKRLGLLVNIYDENSYPSGFAGGHVPSVEPDTASQYVQAELDLGANSVSKNIVSAFVYEKGNQGEIRSPKRVMNPADVPSGQPVMVFRLRRASGNPWTGEFPYVDLTNPQTTPAFLKSTYEAYKREVGAEFGKTIRWAFTDEPLIATGGAYDSAKLALPLSYNTLAEFHKRNGYDLADHLPSLYWDTGDFRRVRFDYWQTLHDLWKENFMRPMFEWNDKNGIQFTGHWMEHEWPYPWITPDDASLYAYEHVPGIDMLEGTKIRLTGSDPHLLFTIRQMASVSHQLGRRAFCEAYGVAGWDSTFEHYKRFGDWLMVHGVNFMDQHLSFSTIRGARKRDHPQSFSDVSPWWPHYRMHADHLARVSYVSSVSEPRNRVLVVQQTISGFLLARRGGATPELERMRANNAELHQFLADRMVDYDLGDEYMIEWFGEQSGKQFRIAKAAYDLVVLPPDMTNLRHQTIPHLERYLAAGGMILALSDPPSFVDGKASGQVREVAQRYARQWRRIDSLTSLAAAVAEQVKPRVRLDRALANVGLLERWLPGGERVLFFANTGLEAARASVTVAGGSVENWDTVSGNVSPARYSVRGNETTFPLELAPAGSQMFVIRESAGQPPTTRPAEYAPVASEAWRASPASPNVLTLDYCDLKVAGEEYRNINSWQANWIAWQRHGFERPAWDNAVQFKTRIFDRNHFAKDSGFEARFRFDVADKAALRGLELAMETPELYRIEVNGTRIDFAAAANWLDPHIRSVQIANLARVGENVVTIAAQPFDVRMELESIYLRGNFRAVESERGFRVASPAALQFGSWARQGYPFYGDRVVYETGIEAPAGAESLRVELGAWHGSVVVVKVDGKEAGKIAWQPYRTEVAVSPGRHTVAVEVVSTPRNTLGPHHNRSKPRMRAWPAAWADFPDHQPAGSAYDVIDYGLMEAPKLSVARAR